MEASSYKHFESEAKKSQSYAGMNANKFDKANKELVCIEQARTTVQPTAKLTHESVDTRVFFNFI